MSAKLGQPVTVQITSGRYSIGAVSKIISGDTVNIVAFTDGVDPWPTIDTFNGLVAGSVLGATKGSGVGQWQEVTVPDTVAAAISAAVASITGFATESYVDTAIDAIPADDYSGLLACPAAGSAVSSPALNTPRRPSTTRPTRVNVYTQVALTSTLLTAQSATLEMRADSGSTPTTVVGGPLTASLGGLAATTTVPMTFTYDVPVGHYYSVVQTAGAGVVTVTRIEESTL